MDSRIKVNKKKLTLCATENSCSISCHRWCLAARAPLLHFLTQPSRLRYIVRAWSKRGSIRSSYASRQGSPPLAHSASAMPRERLYPQQTVRHSQVQPTSVDQNIADFSLCLCDANAKFLEASSFPTPCLSPSAPPSIRNAHLNIELSHAPF